MFVEADALPAPTPTGTVAGIFALRGSKVALFRPRILSAVGKSGSIGVIPRSDASAAERGSAVRADAAARLLGYERKNHRGAICSPVVLAFYAHSAGAAVRGRRSSIRRAI